MSYQSADVSQESSGFLPTTTTAGVGEGLKAKVGATTALLIAVIAFCSGAVLFGDRSAEIETKAITFELEGKHKKSSSEEDIACADGKYSKRTLKLAYELPFAALFTDNKGERKFEASSVIVVDENAYAVCDSSWAISKFGSQLDPFSPGNIQIGSIQREEDESGYEAIIHEDGTFYVVRESIQHDDTSYHAVIEELSLGEVDYEVKDQCSAEFEFEGDSKGFEGALAIQDLNNEMVILGLCEGNYCSETKKNDRGNGRLVAMRKVVESNGGITACQWKTIRMIEIPSSVMFKDYSAITMSESGQVGLTSQEESQFWVGSLLGQSSSGLWDIDALEFDSKKGKLFDFPKNDNCDTVYCNVEGVHWLNDDTIMAVSDKMKGHGKQDFRCFDKDQSVHVFVLPA